MTTDSTIYVNGWWFDRAASVKELPANVNVGDVRMMLGPVGYGVLVEVRRLSDGSYHRYFLGAIVGKTPDSAPDNSHLQPLEVKRMVTENRDWIRAQYERLKDDLPRAAETVAQ